MSEIELLNVEIRPHRSLSDRGFIILISFVTAINCIAGAVFLSMGATLVPFFLALDVVAVLVAFAISYASARRIERVVITESLVRLTEETPRRRVLIWEGPTAFTRLAAEAEIRRGVRPAEEEAAGRPRRRPRSARRATTARCRRSANRPCAPQGQAAPWR